MRITSLFAAAICLAGTGCISQLEYTPDLTTVEQAGVEPAAKELAVILSRSVSPPHSQVKVTDEGLTFSTLEAVGVSSSLRRTKTVHYASVARVELYENGKAFVYDVNGISTWRIRFGGVDDARRFADLLLSLKAWKGPWPPALKAGAIAEVEKPAKAAKPAAKPAEPTSPPKSGDG